VLALATTGGLPEQPLLAGGLVRPATARTRRSSRGAAGSRHAERCLDWFRETQRDTYQAAGQPLEAGRCRRGAEEILDEIRRHDDSAAHSPLISPFAVG
jgi:hypothetical protein